MAEAFIVRRGGGLSLPYRVFGGTAQPSNPKNYDIWVKTSTAITWVEFNNTWSSASNGTVAIQCTVGGSNPTTSNTAMYTIITSVNGISHRAKIQLTGCQQMISGVWKLMEAYSYYGGTWRKFSNASMDLYNASAGGVISTYSGGFTAAALAKTTATTVIQAVAPSVAYNSGDMTVTEPGASSTEKGGILRTTKAITLTGMKNIKLTYTGYGRYNADDTRINVAVWSSIGNAQNVNRSAMVAIANGAAQSGTLTLPISLSGNYYVGIGLCSWGATQSWIKVTKFWVE